MKKILIFVFILICTSCVGNKHTETPIIIQESKTTQVNENTTITETTFIPQNKETSNIQQEETQEEKENTKTNNIEKNIVIGVDIEGKEVKGRELSLDEIKHLFPEMYK